MNGTLRLQHWSVRDRRAIEDLAATLRSTGGSGVIPPERLDAIALPAEPTELARARTLLRHRRLRAAAFDSVQTLFRDPAWDILLGLFIAQEEGQPQTIADAAALSDLSDQAAGRWVRALEQAGLVDCRSAEAAPVPQSIGLTDGAVDMMLSFLAET